MEKKGPPITRKRRSQFRENFKEHSRGMSILYLVLATVVIAVFVGQLLTKNYENCFTCILTLVLFSMPAFLDRKLKITLPNTLEVAIILFIFAAEILGEIRGFYLRYRWWDTMLHASNGFLMAAIGLSLIDIFNRSEVFKFELSPFFVSLVAFCFSMTIGVAWEFFEFAMDIFAGTDMQKDTILQTIATVDLHPAKKNIPVVVEGIENIVVQGKNLLINGAQTQDYALSLGGYLDIGLIDTMSDLFVNFIGAVIFSIIDFFYIKNRGKGNFVQSFIPQLRKNAEKVDQID